MGHYHNNSNKKGAGIVIFSALAGAGITYYLFGTAKGSEHRKRLQQWANEKKNEAMKTGDEVRDAALETYYNLKSLLKDNYWELKDLTRDQKKELVSKLKAHWELMKEDVNDAVEESRDHISKIEEENSDTA